MGMLDEWKETHAYSQAFDVPFMFFGILMLTPARLLNPVTKFLDLICSYSIKVQISRHIDKNF